MPRLNTAGQSVMGIAGQTLSIDGVTPAAFTGFQSGGWDWMSTSLLVGNANVGAGEHLYTYDTGTTTLTLVNSNVTSVTVGGGGVWAAFKAGMGVFTSTGATYPQAGLGDLSIDGDLSLIQLYNADRGVQVIDATGVQVFSQDVQLMTISPLRLRNDVLAFNVNPDGPQLVTVSTGLPLAFAKRSDNIVTTVPVSISGAIYLLEWSVNDILTFRPKDSGTGYVITNTTPFNPDVIEISAGVARIAYSVTTGETKNDLRVVDLTLGSGAVSLGTTAGGAGLVFTPGTPLAMGQFAVSSSGGRPLRSLLNNPISYRETHKVTKEWQKWFNQLSTDNSRPIVLGTQTTGTLPPSQGGAGGPVNVTSAVGTLPQDAKWSQFDTAAVGTQDNFTFTVALSQADVIRCANATTLTLTGLAAGVPGQHLVVIATDADVVFEDDGGSTAENRIETFTGLDVTITIDTAAYLIYDGTSARWRLQFVSTASSTGSGSWIPLVDGSEPPVFITDGAGHLITVAYNP